MQIHCHKHPESLGSLAEVLPSVLIVWRDPSAIPAELTWQRGRAGGLSSAPWPPEGQRSPGFGWEQLWDEELAGPGARFEARKVKGTDAFRI